MRFYRCNCCFNLETSEKDIHNNKCNKCEKGYYHRLHDFETKTTPEKVKQAKEQELEADRKEKKNERNRKYRHNAVTSYEYATLGEKLRIGYIMKQDWYVPDCELDNRFYEEEFEEFF